LLEQRAEQISAWHRAAAAGLVEAVGPELNGTPCVRTGDLRAGFARLAERFDALRMSQPPAPAVRLLLDEASGLPGPLAQLVRSERPPADSLRERQLWLGQLATAVQASRRQLAEEASRQAAGWSYERAAFFEGIAQRSTVELLGNGFVRSVAEQAVQGHSAAVQGFTQRVIAVGQELRRALQPAGAAGPADGADANESGGADITAVGSTQNAAAGTGLAGSSSMEGLAQLATVAAPLSRESSSIANTQRDLTVLLERHAAAFAHVAALCEGAAPRAGPAGAHAVVVV
jgi:hypothetical protein